MSPQTPSGAPAKPAVPAAVPAPQRKFQVRLGHDKGVVDAKNEGEALTKFMAYMGITKSKHTPEITEVT